MNEANKIYEELQKLEKRIIPLSSPNDVGTILWSEVQMYIEEALMAIKKDKRIYGW